MKNYLFLASLIWLLVSGCKPNYDGTYVVYNVSRYDQYLWAHTYGEYQTNDTINKYLKNKLMGTKMNVTFTKDFVNITIPGEPDDLYLKSDAQYNAHGIYSYDHEGTSKVWSYALYKNNEDKLIFEVILRMREVPLFMPVQLTIPFKDYPKVGVAVCELSKVDK